MNKLSALLSALLSVMLALSPLAAGAKSKSAPIYGAIAYHRDSASYGYAVDRRTARSAKIEALNQCGHAQCEIVASFRDACGAVANGPKHFKAAIGAVRPEAETKAMRQCGADCQVVAWACTK